MNKDVFYRVVAAFETAVDKTGQPLTMDSLIVSQGPVTYSHFFTENNMSNDIRSVSKPILSLALGIALDQEIPLRGEPLTLDTRIWRFFEDKVPLHNESNRPWLNNITLKHLLTHTVGYDIGLMFSKDVEDRNPDTLLEYIFNTDISHEPGTHFVYSNVGPYIISALIQEELAINLADWVAHLVFTPLKITDFTWKNYGPYCAASSGLRILHSDLHKIGRLFIEHGTYAGGSLVPASWLAAMTTKHVATPTMYDESRVFPKYAYGYYLWLCKDGTYYCDGTDGQYLIVLPSKDMVITTFGHQADMKPITQCLRPLL